MAGKKKRADSFFGLHFDFHAGPEDTGLGENCDPARVGRLLDAVKPDYVQVDTKGHPGISSYPTKIGYPAPDMKGDILRMWRDETGKRGVALYSHFSGVWDKEAAKRHPDWCAVTVDAEGGESATDKMSVFGPYLDEMLIPQLTELALDYGMDGVWLDGECWAAVVDYSPHARAAWEKKTGGKRPPRPGEAGYADYIEFNREGFRAYVARYVKALHARAPGFEIASNWFYTSFTPEKPTVDVDFISGDMTPQDSLNAARFEGRMAMNQGKPWDLMAWGFSITDGYHVNKSARQLTQECAAILSLGGGFQIYNVQNRGTIEDSLIGPMAEVAAFAREREACRGAKAVADVGVICSTKGFYGEIDTMFTYYGSPTMTEARGLTTAFLDAGYSTELLMTHQLAGRCDAYSALVLPDWAVIEDELKAELLAFAREGGTLILAGPRAAAHFGEVNRLGEVLTCETRPVYIEHENKIGGFRAACASYRRPMGEGGFGALYAQNNRLTPPDPAGYADEIGKGRVISLAFAGGTGYVSSRTVELAGFFTSLAERHISSKARLTAEGRGGIALAEKEGALFVHILNTAGEHADPRVRSFDFIPPLRSVKATVRCPEPRSVTLEPENLPAEYVWKDGVLTLSLAELDIHAYFDVRF